MWPFPRTPSPADRELARKLLDQAQTLQNMAARLLGLRLLPDSASTSSPVSTASSSSTSKPKVRGLESVSILDRETLLRQDLERQAHRIPERKLEPEPDPSSLPTSGKTVTGGFGAITNASAGTRTSPGNNP